MNIFFRRPEVKWYTILFIFFSFILIFPFILHHTTFIHIGDGYEQYFPTYVYIGRYLQDILHGRFRLYDFAIGYGEDIIESLNYYGFGDPLNLFAIFISEKNADFLFSFFIFVRLYIAGIGMIFFLNHRGYTDSKITAGGGIIYVFSLFTIWQGLWFYTFLTAMYLFPFLIIQVEKVSDGKNTYKNGILFSVLIAIQGCCGFYFLYIQTILMAIYWLVICNHSKSFREIFIQIKMLLFFYVLGILLSAAFLFPALNGLFHSARTIGGNEGWDLIFDLDRLKTIFSNLLVPIVKTGSESLGIPVVCIFVIVGCFSAQYIKRRELTMTILLLVLYISPAFRRVSNGFSYAETRWIYVIYFWIAYITVVALTRYKDHPFSKPQMVISCILALFSVSIHYLMYLDKIRTFGYFILIYITAYMLWTQKNKFLDFAIFICILTNLFFISASWHVCGQDLYGYYTKADEIEELFAAETEQNNDTRIDMNGITPNDGLISGYHGTSEYLSVENGNIYDFYEWFLISSGTKGSRHRLEGLDDRMELQHISGIDAWGKWYENAISEAQFETIPAAARQSVVIDTIILNADMTEEIGDREVYNIAYEVEYSVINKENDQISVDEESFIILHLDKDEYQLSGEKGGIYLELNGVDLLDNSIGILTVNDKEIYICNEEYKFNFGTGNYLVKLKECDEIIIRFQSENIYKLGEVSVYWSDDTKIQNELEEQSENLLQNISCSAWKVSGTISKNKPGWLFLSVPFHKNWKAYIDGQETEIVRANIGFMAVSLETGEHTILLKYCPVWFIIGGICSLCAAIACVILWNIKVKSIERTK